ncbi:MFS transporter [Candidatus Bathyarchaeota archaeon]|nr:MFS transporter [Candidatus Bathyarchaeota archaeon]
MGLFQSLKEQFSFITGNYRILVISWMIMDLASEMPNPNFQYYVEEVLNGKGIALGIIGMAGFLGMAAVAFPGGYLADKYGRRWLITTMTFGMASSYLLFAFAPTWHFVLIGTIVNALCLIYQPALFAMVQDSLPPERRGMGSSIIQLIHSTFNTPGPLIAGYLLLHFGLEWSMRIIYMLVTALFLTAAVWRLRLKETVVSTEPIRFRYFISAYPKAIKESFGVWKVVPRSMLWLLFSQILIMFGMALMNVINALYARDVLQIPKEQWWLVFVPLLVTNIIASIPIGKAVDKFGRKTPLILGLLCFSTGTLIFLQGNLFMVMIAMILFGIGGLLFMTAMMALSTDLVAAESRGKVNGFTNFTGYIVMGVGMFLGNYFYVNFFPQLPFLITLALAVPTLLILLFFVHESPSKEAV